MKRIFSICLILAMLTALCACDRSANQPATASDVPADIFANAESVQGS